MQKIDWLVLKLNHGKMILNGPIREQQAFQPIKMAVNKTDSRICEAVAATLLQNT